VRATGNRHEIHSGTSRRRRRRTKMNQHALIITMLERESSMRWAESARRREQLLALEADGRDARRQLRRALIRRAWKAALA